MKNPTKYLLPVMVVGLVACNTATKQVYLKKGAYFLKKTDSEISDGKINSSPYNFVFATLHIEDNDSLTFPGFKAIGKELFGQNKFKYQISGNEITLYNKDFKETFDFEITKDSLLKLGVDKDKYKNLYFEYQNLNLQGKYKIFSYTRNKTMPWENLNVPNIKAILNTVAFEFSNDKSVKINPKLVQYLLKEPNSIDSIFQYKVGKNEIVFSNAKQNLKLPYSYDGILHLHINDENFEKFDLGKTKNE